MANTKLRKRQKVFGDEACLNISEVMDFLGCGRTTVFKLVNEGHLPARKVLDKTVYLKSDLLKFLDNCIIQPKASK